MVHEDRYTQFAQYAQQSQLMDDRPHSQPNRATKSSNIRDTENRKEDAHSTTDRLENASPSKMRWKEKDPVE